MDNQILGGKELQIDKTNWNPVKFGDLADEISDRVEKPESSDFDRFVGLDHFVSGDLKIKSWASTKNLASAAKVFKAGDILFARRNAYLRRASLVEFDGCCSGDAIVIREKQEKVVPGFLTFILNSNNLWEYAISNAAGTMSQRVKWRDLAEYEFLLPPKDEQARLAELLWALDEVIERDQEILKQSRIFNELKREQLILENVKSWLSLEVICEQKISYGIVQAGPDIEDGMPYIKSSDLSHDGINPSHLQRTSKVIAEKYKRSEVRPGDIVFSLRGNLGQMNFVPETLSVANLTQGTARINVKREFLALYVKYALETNVVQGRVHALSKGSTFKEISLEALRSVKVPFPENFSKQIKISEIIQDSILVNTKAKEKINVSKTLQNSLINKIF